MNIYISDKVHKKGLLSEDWVKQGLETLSEYKPLQQKLKPGSNLKKLSGFTENVFSIRVGIKPRFVFAFETYGGERSLFILDILPGHDIPKDNAYDEKVKMIRRMSKEAAHAASKIPDELEVLSALSHQLQTAQSVYEFNHNAIVLSEEQNQVVRAKLPLLINGPPGSGKTSSLFIILCNLLEQKKHHLSKKYLYITRNKALVSLIREEWIQSGYAAIAKEKNLLLDFKYAQCDSYQEIDDDFLYQSLINQKNLASSSSAKEAYSALNIGLEEIKTWFYAEIKAIKKRVGKEKHMDIEFDSFMQEKGILSGYQSEAYLSDDFGERNSLFTREQRAVVYRLYESYLRFAAYQQKENQRFDFGLCRISQTNENAYDMVFVDEAQDFTMGQLDDYRSLCKEDQIILSMDSNQKTEKGLSFRPHINQLFSIDGKSTLHSHFLLKTFRCPESVVQLANTILEMKRKVTGGVADKSEYACFEAQAVSEEKGFSLMVSHQCFSDASKRSNEYHDTLLDKAEFSESLHQVTDAFKDTDIVIVAHADKLQEAKSWFKNHTVFTPEEIKGLEFPCVIAYQLFTGEDFKKADKLLAKSEKSNNHRAKNGEAQPLFAAIFNEVFTAVTRAQQGIVIIQEESREITHILSSLKDSIAQNNKQDTMNSPESASNPTAVREPKRVTSTQDWERQVMAIFKQGGRQAKIKAREVYEERLAQKLQQSFEQYLEGLNIKSKTNASIIQKPENKKTHVSATVNSNPKKEKNSRQPKFASRNKNKVNGIPENKVVPQAIKSQNQYIPSPEEEQKQRQFAGIILEKFKPDFFEGYLNKLTPQTRHWFLLEMSLPDYGDETFFATVQKNEQLKAMFDALYANNSSLWLDFFKNNKNRISIRTFYNAVSKSLVQMKAKKKRKDLIDILVNELKAHCTKHPALINYVMSEKGRWIFAEAVEAGDEALVKALLLFESLDVNKSEARNVSPINLAAVRKNVKIIDMLIQHGADINQRTDKEGITPVYIACMQNNLDSVELFAKNRADLNIADFFGATPVCIAAENGYSALIDVFGRYGANLNTVTVSGVPSIYLAAQNGHTAVIKKFVEYHADLNISNNDDQTPAFVAAKNNNVQALKVLAASGANLELRNKNGLSPACIAVIMGHSEALEVLIEYKADLKIEVEGITLLCYAAKNGHGHIIKKLVELGADVNYAGANELLPVHAAAQHGCVDALRLLAELGANLDVPLKGLTPLYLAVCARRIPVIDVLIEYGADMNLTDDNGITPICTAAKWADGLIVEKLAIQGADLDKANDDWGTPAYIAAQGGFRDVVRVLGDWGADLEKPVTNGNTPAHIATEGGHVSVIDVLAKHGVNLNKTGHNNITPVFIAAQKELVFVLIELIKNGVDINLPYQCLVADALRLVEASDDDTKNRMIAFIHEKNLKDSDIISIRPYDIARILGNHNSFYLLSRHEEIALLFSQLNQLKNYVDSISSKHIEERKAVLVLLERLDDLVRSYVLELRCENPNQEGMQLMKGQAEWLLGGGDLLPEYGKPWRYFVSKMKVSETIGNTRKYPVSEVSIFANKNTEKSVQTSSDSFAFENIKLH